MTTPLQALLAARRIPEARVREYTGRSRTTVYRWRVGISYPHPDDVVKLIALYGRDQLDYNGCYEVSDAGVS